ncbi:MULTISPECIES: carbohydrate ABC transporter permease [Diplocloster]|uniref:Sugar ABC transporter permease n=2 Tax=Diplocloster TaxID=2918511 RepID=A0A949JYT7_9FIRM|nr:MULTISPECIES: sugar ABC transporter permease [Lachnospiraceae]SCJ79258.1 sn-glycerol-3-phosphate transport system permease protein ugpA [uncultured Clostridium sp.]MBU9726556.1 sugar ABC transporter permease [Diplocloster modestus]MBU9737723.1 sugar ABC transporter permease [Diplocloster agilis]MBU9743149.1 sugar ABC transporter permease [Diplocloster agilis]MCU6735667.1 sugar ABC transporter permease [Suonthocola fibrivorans]
MKTKERLKTLSFLAPALIIYFIIIVFPTFYSVILSFFDWNGISEKKFIGIKNYVNLFTNDAVFRIALKNNIIWIVLTVCITVVLALLLALVLNNRFKGRIVYRSIFYFPYMLSWIIVGIIWKWMYNPNFGMINTFLDALGLDSLKGAYLSNPKIALYCVFIAALWQGLGQPMLYFLAGLQTMSSDVLEAARIDGAGKFNLFIRVIVPMLKETFVIVLATQIIASMKVYDIVYVMTDSGPANATQTLATYMYNQTFSYNSLGAGSAVATVMMAIMMVIIVPYVIYSTKED